ncbi:MAG: bifunctional (p)ppGpp synthetase/guanosine-3',5'-bis(diphosphate) 3'-pyrophosphohydrolase [Lachnospiraceae bacterium]|nr:bifunctional (p)ppGpp synthetase/guanosine-3',5'-bis(diphosphate) 3'-pyrophosphohydrolase [Lachnospiraceae bacterium]MBP5414251.1 bifunctional (p)ppGpp synthetase/guanosine-3',5'-bis(diphosphate) 3'-pyrophosphohydrolase [Lachnospiraceae bacterium]MBP5744929.1 bifunctional (p)ppGpp synthetase/guanosine-3',5'-bis(diphosphate) 3'-pyrophosphohydrolase [Lachnospiraceae bacterium]
MEEMKTQEQVHNSVVIDDGRIEALDEFLAPEQLYNDLITRVRKYHPSGDISLIEKAYNVANDAHKGQTRKSGEPYIIHPLYVAIILADLELDKETIVAGLLHDVVEDTVMTIDEIKTEFGDDVALLVDGVTKLQMQMDDANLDYSAIKLEMQAENLRKMFLAMAKDIRVILIKLADRLHNMRTLKHMPPEKQQRIARETLDIYSPIAMRLGISKIKVELDDLSLKYLQPEIYYDLANQIAEKKSEREHYIQEIVDEVSEHIRAAGIEAKIDGRVKHFFSIYKKMKNQGKTLDQIYDLFAVRIIVDSVKDCYACLGVIHEIYKPIPGRFKDYIAMPKENMYQSLHTTLIGSKGQPFEIQIRTFEMHKAAEYGIAAHWKYKEASDGKRPEQGEEEKLDWLKRILEWQKDMSDNNEFMNSLKSDLNLFSDNVYCFTPTGEVKNLPAGSTPVDFAYSIHSAVGNRMVGARVNGRLVTIDYEIKNGDRIEVITSQNSKGPSRDWLKIAKSAQAKNKINQWFKQELKEDNITKGKELLMSFCKAKNIDTAIVTNPDYMQAIMDKYNFRDWDGILAAVGHGGLKEGQIVNKMVEMYEKDHPRQLTDEEIIASVGEHAMKHSHTSGSKSGIVVKGIEDVAVRFSKCCSPVPGDEIVGFVTRGRGISIHRNDCINVLNLSETDRSRLIDAEWQADGDKLNEKYLADIRIYANDRPGLLGDVSRVFTERGITIVTLNSHMGKNRVATMSMSFEISGRDELKSIVDKLRNIDGVIDIERSTG